MIRLIPFAILVVMGFGIPESWGFWPRFACVVVVSIAFYLCVMREREK